MPREDTELAAAKRSYRSAKDEGNRQEEARWANLIGDILKNRGEYVQALKWFRIDYDVSSKFLSEKHLLPTCQSMGEVHLRLEHFNDALIYQKKHLELAKDSNDLVEQQRASTQLGRTYHEMFLKSSDDHYSIRNAKKYFRSAMNLARALKENPPDRKSSFLKEYIDAHNNIGMLEIDLDNLEEAEKVLTKGLEICDEEEVAENDDGRTRLHHNLGNVYLQLRTWDKAKHHIEKDIIICKNIGHRQGEAKGYINLGELHYRVQKYDEASLCYQNALTLAKLMEDEDALVEQINGNIETVKEAIKVMHALKSEEQNLKKLTRNLAAARGTPAERKCLLQQNRSVDCLIDKAALISAWRKHLEFAKRKKRIASELYDKEKLSDSYLVIGESYQKLRNFSKALKWYNKSWQIYKSIGNMEGQAMVKINIGDVLDCDGSWAAARDAFEEGYRIAKEAGLPSVELSALENMHYSHMIRFDNIEEAKRLQLLIDDLKKSQKKKDAENAREDCCSETDTEGEGNDDLAIHKSGVCSSPVTSTSNSCGTKHHNSLDELNDDSPLISFFHSNKSSSKLKATAAVSKPNIQHITVSPEYASKSSGSLQNIVGRKRARLVLSDDDDDEVYPTRESSKGSLFEYPAEGAVHKNKNVSTAASKYTTSSANPVYLEESTCSYKSSMSNKVSSKSRKEEISRSDEIVAYDTLSGGSKSNFNSEKLLHNPRRLECQASDENYEQYVTFQIENDIIRVKIDSKLFAGKTNIDYVKAQLACLYYLQLPTETRVKGLLPIIQQLKVGGQMLECSEDGENINDLFGKDILEVSVGGWIQKPLMKLYIDFCKDLSEAPNLKLLTSLYNLEVSEDEVIVSDCELQDVSITPLLNAMHVQGTIALLNLSHNLLGNGTMEKLQQILKSSGQNYGDLSLDLHCNRFGPTTLFQICQCPVLFDRLVMLNISGNRLTDACGSYLSTILKKCKALYSLNIENCSITSRTIHKVADALDATSVLTQLYTGHNDFASGVAIVSLLSKLATMSRFSDLSLSGLKLSKPVVEILCQLARTLSLSGLMLGGTSIGTEGALQLIESLSQETQELVKLDLSGCGLSSHYFSTLDTKMALFCGIQELNLGGNTINQEGTNALAAVLSNPDCCIRVLKMNKCGLGFSGVVQIIQALAENNSLKELILADNIDKAGSSNPQSGSRNTEPSPSHKEPNLTQNIPCALNREADNLEVADSEDENMETMDQSCASSCEKIPLVPNCPFVKNISTAIGFARQLEILDLSGNGFSVEAVESFYATWTDSRASSARRHEDGTTVHFSVRENRCCHVKPCCRRD